MGFYVIDPAAGTILGQFPHFLPASIAIGYGLDGLTGVRRVTHFWALLGLVSVYILGARLFGRTVAAAGTLLLAINVIEVWFSGYPNAEVVAQTLLFAAMLAWSRAQVDGLAVLRRGRGVAARHAAVPARRHGHRASPASSAPRRSAAWPACRPVVGFFPALVVWLAAAGLYLLGLMQPYMWIPLIWLRALPVWQMAARRSWPRSPR